MVCSRLVEWCAVAGRDAGREGDGGLARDRMPGYERHGGMGATVVVKLGWICEDEARRGGISGAPLAAIECGGEADSTASVDAMGADMAVGEDAEVLVGFTDDEDDVLRTREGRRNQDGDMRLFFGGAEREKDSFQREGRGSETVIGDLADARC